MNIMLIDIFISLGNLFGAFAAFLQRVKDAFLGFLARFEKKNALHATRNAKSPATEAAGD